MTAKLIVPFQNRLAAATLAMFFSAASVCGSLALANHYDILADVASQDAADVSASFDFTPVNVEPNA